MTVYNNVIITIPNVHIKVFTHLQT